MCMHLKSFLKQVQEVPVPLGLHFFIGDEAQGRTVDAVAHAIGGLRIAGEHMTKVRISGHPDRLPQSDHQTDE